jgi:cell division protease FtsH
MVTRYGMSVTLGNRVFGKRDELVFLGKELGEHQKDYSEEVAAKIDIEVSRIVDEGYKRAEQLINKNKKKMEEVSDVLLKKETLEAPEFNKLMKGAKA